MRRTRERSVGSNPTASSTQDIPGQRSPYSACAAATLPATLGRSACAACAARYARSAAGAGPRPLQAVAARVDPGGAGSRETEVLGAGPGERSPDRSGYCTGCYSRSLITRIGKLKLRVPRDREGRFSTELFERYQRSEKALVSALAKMYVQGGSTRKVKAITEELCGQPPHQPGSAQRAEKGGDEARRLTSPASWPCLSICTT